MSGYYDPYDDERRRLEQERLEREREARIRRQKEYAEQIRRQQAGGQQAGRALNNIPYAKEAAAMYALVKGGNEIGIGARDQGREYKRFGRKLDDELWEKMKFWEWF